jgi:hypothetical protein
MTTKKRARGNVIGRHSLSLSIAGVVGLWLALYLRADPSTHMGAFYSNAIADWAGTLMIVVATKYLHEIGSAESRDPHPRHRGPATRFLIDHSLTIGLVLTGVIWAMVYARINADGKTGQVVGSMVSEWVQVLGIVVITKYAREVGSKESR